MKKVCVTLMMALFCLTALAFDIPKKPNPQRLVNDYIGLLSSEQVGILERKLVDFDNKTSIQITIVILDDLDGAEASDVATEIGHTWGVGHKGIDNGIVFLIVKYNQGALEKLVTSKHGDYFIATGYGLEPYLTDYDVKSIGESNFIPHAKEDEYYEGITETVDAIISDLGEIGWQQREELEAKRKAERQASIRAFFTITGLVLGCIILLGLLIWLYVRIRNAYREAQETKKRRASLKAQFQKTKHEYEQLFSFIPKDISGYPDWAKKKHGELIYAVEWYMKVPAEGVLKDFSVCIETNMVRASQLLSTLNDIITELEAAVEKLKNIPKEIQKYQKEAPQKLAAAKESLETFRVSIQVLKDKGFKLPMYENKLSGFRTSLAAIEKKADMPTESKLVYETSEDAKEEIERARQNMNEHIVCHTKAAEGINQLSATLTLIIPKKMKEARIVLDDLKKEYPKQNWEDLDKKFTSVAASIEDCKTLKKNAEEKNDMKTQDFEGAKKLMTDATEKAESILHCFIAIHNRKTEIVAAKQGFANALKDAEKKLKEAKSKLSDDDVEDGAKRTFAEAEKKLTDAKKKSSGDMIDWLIVFALILAAHELAKKSYSMAEDDIEEAERRRRQKKEEEQRKKREEESNNSYYSSHSHFGGGGFSGGGGGGFGGFGGGGFGGGGAGGSW